ncbi:MAG: energy transducer TonB [Vicinamibacterales bacterium]
MTLVSFRLELEHRLSPGVEEGLEVYMRRITLAALVLLLAAVPAAFVLAQSQDPLITSARQAVQQGDHDGAISMLRFGLASRPGDEAIKQELVNVLMRKQEALRQQVAELSREISELRGTAAGRSSISASGISAGISASRVGAVGASAPVRVGGTIKTPTRIVDVKPVYPQVAQSARVQGMVILEALIDEFGAVADAKVLRGQPLLNEAAIEAVRQWRYSPTLLNGVPVPVIMTVTVTFTLQD